jgi:hypothetical protein
MKKPTLISAALLAAAAFATQGGLDFVSPDGNVEAHGAGGRMLLEGEVYRFDIIGGTHKVHAMVHDQGLEFYSGRLQGVAVPDPKKPKSMMLKRATASGGVQVIKSSESERSEITGTTATFSGTAASGSLTLAGPVKLTNVASAKSQRLTATGSSMIAALAAAGKKELPIRTASLRGPVTIDASERTRTGGLDTVHATGSRLDIDNTVKPAKLSLSGGVKVDSPQHGHFGGSTVILRVNERGEVVSIEASK